MRTFLLSFILVVGFIAVTMFWLPNRMGYCSPKWAYLSDANHVQAAKTYFKQGYFFARHRTVEGKLNPPNQTGNKVPAEVDLQRLLTNCCKVTREPSWLEYSVEVSAIELDYWMGDAATPLVVTLVFDECGRLWDDYSGVDCESSPELCVKQH